MKRAHTLLTVLAILLHEQLKQDNDGLHIRPEGKR
jgi:hypothetical protein